MLSDELIEFHQQIEQIEEANKEFKQSLKALKVNLHADPQFVKSRYTTDLDRLHDVATEMFYEDDQEVNNVRPAVGIIQVKPDDREIINAFNQSRESWAKYIASIRNKKGKIGDEYISLPKALMHASGYTRLHRIQMKRGFHVIEGEPIRLSCKRCANQKIERVSKGDLLERIENYEGSSSYAMDAVKQSSSDVFAVKGASYFSLKANVSYLDSEGEVCRKLVATTLPVVFVTNRFSHPEIVTAKDRINTKKRGKRTIKDSVLASIGDAKIHEYVNHVRRS